MAIIQVLEDPWISRLALSQDRAKTSTLIPVMADRRLQPMIDVVNAGPAMVLSADRVGQPRALSAGIDVQATATTAAHPGQRLTAVRDGQKTASFWPNHGHSR